jgi:hypothetical protein
MTEPVLAKLELYHQISLPDTCKTCLGMEYFFSEGDELWEMSDQDLVRFASQEIVNLGLVNDIANSDEKVSPLI